MSAQSISLLRPACLPLSGDISEKEREAVQAGWSSPPPISVVASEASQFVPQYSDWFKLWHYKMELVPCRDPSVYAIWPSNSAVQFPSNTYYPPGTVCAQEISFGFCPSSGESGSPLIVRENAAHQERFVVAGILSFTKGCSNFEFGIRNPNRSQLKQRSVNPAVYTRLHCSLPWIAEQYNLQLPSSATIDPDCSKGQGNPSDEDICRNAPDKEEEPEVPCIFPFYLDNVEQNSCVLNTNLESFTIPVFLCPIRSVRGQEINGVLSFTRADLGSSYYTSYCPTNSHRDPAQAGRPVVAANGLLELDPANTDCSRAQRNRTFVPCKNNCPGGELRVSWL